MAKPEDLLGPACPEPLVHVLGWFAELGAARGSNGFGPEPIGYAEIDAWSRLTGRDPDPFEVRAIRALDRVFLHLVAEARAKGRG